MITIIKLFLNVDKNMRMEMSQFNFATLPWTKMLWSSTKILKLTKMNEFDMMKLLFFFLFLKAKNWLNQNKLCKNEHCKSSTLSIPV